jgi:hypothetical protein
MALTYDGASRLARAHTYAEAVATEGLEDWIGAHVRMFAFLATGGRMRQPMMSLMEAAANVVVGYWVAVMTQALVFPMFGLDAALRDNLTIGAIFTIVFLARSCAHRRAVEALRATNRSQATGGASPDTAVHP